MLEGPVSILRGDAAPQALGVLPGGWLTMALGGETLREKLVQANLGWLRGWMRGRVGDRDLADDLCQDVLLKALRRLPRLRDESRFSGWLYRIAENTVRDHVRSEKRRRGRVQFTSEIEGFDRSAPPSGDPAVREEAERLLAAIRALPARLREPLLLRHSRGLPYAEIARILGVSENAVQVRIFRARERLRRAFQKDSER